MHKYLHIIVVVAVVFGASNLTYVCAQEEAIAEAKPATDKNSAAEAPAKLRPLTISVQLTGETKIVGTLTDSTQIQIKTAFGEATIPLSEVAGVRLATGDDTSTSIVMLNGDSITGATDLKVVTVETEWGIAKINGSSIMHMLFVPGLQWQQVAGIGGKRWNLTEARQEVSQASATGNVQPQIRNQPLPIPGSINNPQFLQNPSNFPR